MKIRFQRVWIVALVCLVGLGLVQTAGAEMIVINSNTFDLDQFTGASVTYREDGSVDFDGKLWDNAVGVDGVTLGELAAGQAGGDPGDQVTLQSRGSNGPDWLQLNYSGPGIQVADGGNNLVLYEITSSNGPVDVEGTSFRVQFNNDGTWHNASEGVATFFDGSGLSVENTIQIVFDLYNFGFNSGDFLQTLRIENLDTGFGTSDPDFIFAGLTASTTVVPEPSSMALFGFGGLGLLSLARRRRQRGTACEAVS